MRGRGSVITRAAAALQDSGINPKTAVLSQSFLRLETALNTATSTYRFGVLNNENPTGVAPYATEVRLAQQDSFFVDSVSVYVAKPASVSDTSFRLYTHPNANVFTTGAGELMKVYNGRLSYKKDGNVLCPAWPLIDHLDVPNTQQNASNGLMDELHPKRDGRVYQDRSWILKGSANTIIQAELPASLASVDANARLVVIFHGVLAQNTGFVI